MNIVHDQEGNEVYTFDLGKYFISYDHKDASFATEASDLGLDCFPAHIGLYNPKTKQTCTFHKVCHCSDADGQLIKVEYRSMINYGRNGNRHLTLIVFND